VRDIHCEALVKRNVRDINCEALGNRNVRDIRCEALIKRNVEIYVVRLWEKEMSRYTL